MHCQPLIFFWRMVHSCVRIRALTTPTCPACMSTSVPRLSISSQTCAGQVNFPGAWLWWPLSATRRLLTELLVLSKIGYKPCLVSTSSVSSDLPSKEFFSSPWFHSSFPEPLPLAVLCAHASQSTHRIPSLFSCPPNFSQTLVTWRNLLPQCRRLA